MRALLLAILLVPLSGCSYFAGDQAPGCADERVNRLERKADTATPPWPPSRMADAENGAVVYIWDLEVRGACRGEHAFLRFDAEVLSPAPPGCSDTQLVQGYASTNPFVTPRTIPVAYKGDGLYHGEDQYGLKQAPGDADSAAGYFLGMTIQIPNGDRETATGTCAQDMVKLVKVVSTDYSYEA